MGWLALEIVVPSFNYRVYSLWRVKDFVFPCFFRDQRKHLIVYTYGLYILSQIASAQHVFPTTTRHDTTATVSRVECVANVSRWSHGTSVPAFGRRI